MNRGSVHISYETQDRNRMYEAYLRIVLKCREIDDIDVSDYKVLDLASGRGEFLQLLTAQGMQAAGMDIDEECVKMSSRFAPCTRGDLNQVDECFPENSFDVVLLSHVIEHLRDPLAVLNKARRVSKKWLIIAVPNPLSPRGQVYAVLRRFYTNKGHYYAWDYSHFHNFLTRYGEMEVREITFDEVKIPGKYIRKFLKFLFLRDFLELKLLPKLFPNYSTSLIAVVKK